MKIPPKPLKQIIDSILANDFHDRFEYNCCCDSQDVLDKYERFNITTDQEGFTYGLNTYLIELLIKVNYEALRGEVVNDVVFSIDELTAYDNEGDEMALDYVQAEQIKQAVESKNYKA